MNKAIKDFVDMMEIDLLDLDTKPEYLKSLRILMNEPEYKALKSLSEQKLIVTDEILRAALGRYNSELMVFSSKELCLKAALEAVFDMINKESVNNAQCNHPIMYRCEVCEPVNADKPTPKKTLLEWVLEKKL